MKTRISFLERLAPVGPLLCVLSLGCNNADKNGSNKSTPISRPTTEPSEPVNEPPTAVIVDSDVSPQVSGTPRLYRFSAAQSTDRDGTVVSYEWDFGDGTAVVSGRNVRHNYDTLGEYVVTLTVTDDRGATGSAQRGILADGKAPVITAIKPVRFHVESSGTIWVRGHNLGRVVGVTLTSADHPDLYQKMLGRNSEEELIAEFDFYQAKPGIRSVIVTDRYGRIFTLTDAFHLVSKQDTAGKGG